MEERSHNREQTRDSELTLCRHVRIAIFTDVFIQIDRFRDPAAPEVDRVPRVQSSEFIRAYQQQPTKLALSHA